MTNTIAGVVIVMLASGVVVALLDAQMAGILQRYFADFTFMFLSAAVLLAFISNEALTKYRTIGTHAIFLRVVLVLVVVSVLYSMLLCFVPETGWVSDVYPWAYQSIVEMIQFWT